MHLVTCKLKISWKDLLDAAEFLDPPLAFTYRENDSNFNFNAISVDKVYIDCWIKILGRLFVNDKQILTECFKSFLILEGLVVRKAYTYLNKPATEGCKFV